VRCFLRLVFFLFKKKKKKKKKQIVGQGLEALDQRFHPECFVCGKCKKKIAGSFVARPGNIPWHKECADEGKVLEACKTCHKPLQGKVSN
jgi:hypothetical protein